MKLADYKGFEARRAEAKSRGKLRGIGFSSYIEACGLAPSQVIGQLGGGVWPMGNRRRSSSNPTGNVQIMTGAHSHGQSHETTFAQLISDKLGVPFDQIEVVHGDTATTPFGMGTYGSRSLAVGGSAIMKGGRQDHRQGQEDRRPSDGGIGRRRRVRERHLPGGRHGQETCRWHRRCLPLMCRTTIRWPSSSPAWTRTPSTIRRTSSIPAGTQICEVEIDPDTGEVQIVNFTAVDDFGKHHQSDGGRGARSMAVSPRAVGQALLEAAVYDKGTGQPHELLVHGLHHAARGKLPVVQARLQGHTLPAQFRWA